MRRAREGDSDLDRDLARLRALMGDRFDTIRDNLPEILDRYAELRDRDAMRAAIRRWRERRANDGAEMARAHSAEQQR